MSLVKVLPALALTGLIALGACKKGDEGPQGPKGNANVIYSAWKMTTPWVASTSSTGSGKATFYYDMAVSELNQGIVDSGTVLVYAKFVSDPDGANLVKQLPSIYYNVGGASTQYRFQHAISLNTIRVICDIIPAGSPATTNQVRYVIIPAGTAATLRMPDLKSMSYSEVCSFYHIPE